MDTWIDAAKRSAWGAALLVLVALAVYGARPPGNLRDDRNTITVWAWPGALQGLQSGYDEFKQAYPEIKVNFVEIPWAGGGLPTKLQIALMAGSGAPDVTGLLNLQAPPFIEYEAMWDVTDRIAAELDRFPAYKVDECRDSQDRVRAVPWDIGPTGLFYQQYLFERYGEKLPETWDSFVELGIRMRERGHYMLPMARIPSQGLTLEMFEMLLRQQGGGYFAAADKVTIDSPEAARALRLMLRMRDAGITIDAGEGPVEWGLYKSGKILCRIRPCYDSNSIPDYVGTRPEDGYGGWAIGFLPAFTPGGARAASGYSSLLAIPATSPKKEAAWKFVHFMTATIPGARSQIEYGGLSAYLPSLMLPDILEIRNPFFGGQQINKMFIELNRQIVAGSHFPPSYEASRQIMRSALELLWKGERTVEETLARAQAEIERVNEEYL